MEKWRTIEISPIDNTGNLVGAKQTIRGGYFEDYEISPPSILGWTFDHSDEALIGRFTTEQAEVNLVYRLNDATILDPLNPEEEITPEQMPELPETLESFRIDYAPALSFGTQKISNKKEEYYAEALRVDGSIDARPNFVQISNFDRSTTSWSLSIRQESQFHT
ncbi:WxL domain-containing protein, partial [Enterobacter roggenkampii]|uniref:WxL domain-containing protein n=1 Tax=Enterobacter roggenkampii TaxID=1812935 RepID=UPI0021D2FC55